MNRDLKYLDFFFIIEVTKDLLLNIVSKTSVNLIYDDLKNGIEKNFLS